MLEWAGPAAPVQVLANTKLAPWLKLGGVLYFLFTAKETHDGWKLALTVDDWNISSISSVVHILHRIQSYQVFKNWNVGHLNIFLKQHFIS